MVEVKIERVDGEVTLQSRIELEGLEDVAMLQALALVLQDKLELDKSDGELLHTTVQDMYSKLSKG